MHLMDSKKENKGSLLKSCLVMLTLFLSSQYYLNAQQNNGFYSLVSQSTSDYIDTLYLWDYEDLDYPLADSTICLFLKENNINVMNYNFNNPIHGIIEQRNGLIKFYNYSYDSVLRHGTWHYAKSIRLKRKKSIHVLLAPGYDFASDTLIITMKSAFLHLGKPYGFRKTGKTWITSICDWGIFKYVYSIEEKNWILVNSSINGI